MGRGNHSPPKWRACYANGMTLVADAATPEAKLTPQGHEAGSGLVSGMNSPIAGVRPATQS